MERDRDGLKVKEPEMKRETETGGQRDRDRAPLIPFGFPSHTFAGLCPHPGHPDPLPTYPGPIYPKDLLSSQLPSSACSEHPQAGTPSILLSGCPCSLWGLAFVPLSLVPYWDTWRLILRASELGRPLVSWGECADPLFSGL